MDWRSIIRAVDGEPAAMKDLMQMDRNEWTYAGALIGALLLLEDAPHPAAALVVAGIAAPRSMTRPVAAALAHHAAPALAEWRADPTWAKRCIGIRTPYNLIDGVAHLIGALRTTPAALHAAAGIVARDDRWESIDACLAALGADGWGLLADEERGALWSRALWSCPATIGEVWPALTDAQREDAAQHAAAGTCYAASFIGGIGAAAWEAIDAALRERLIDAAARAPWFIHCCVPAWTGMSDAERARLVTAVVDDGSPRGATDLLRALGRDGRRALSSAQRVALDVLAAQDDEWGTALLRVVDAGWNGVDDDDRRTLMARAATSPPFAASFIRAGGSDGWRALPPDVQAALRASVQRDPSALLACPPALWRDLVGGRSLPPTSSVSPWTILQWRAEDAAAAPIRLPPEHQAMVLALAPWRAADCVPSAPRMARLLDVWNSMMPDERDDLATAHPWTLAVVAAAARLAARESEIAATRNRTTAAVADALAVMTLRSEPKCVTRCIIGRLLAAGARWRPWMRAFAPTGDDAPEAWDAWLRAARRGAILDRGVGLRLAARGVLRAARSAMRPRFR